jgi:CDGSH-type Zn-finger protein
MATPNIAQKSPFVRPMEAGTYFWCSCGLSKNQPFCDGSHKGSEFSPKKVELTEKKTVAWCGCKQSKNGAFCDGSHKTL